MLGVLWVVVFGCRFDAASVALNHSAVTHWMQLKLVCLVGC
jgi:hypothetical protein